MTAHREQATHPAWRWFGLGVALVLPASTALKVAHYATVEHSRCAEHGDLVHGDATADHASVVASGPYLSSSAEAHGHEHCETPAMNERQDALALAAPYVSMPMCACELAELAFENAAVDARSIYRLAPKTSPPV